MKKNEIYKIVYGKYSDRKGSATGVYRYNSIWRSYENISRSSKNRIQQLQDHASMVRFYFLDDEFFTMTIALTFWE